MIKKLINIIYTKVDITSIWKTSLYDDRQSEIRPLNTSTFIVASSRVLLGSNPLDFANGDREGSLAFSYSIFPDNYPIGRLNIFN